MAAGIVRHALLGSAAGVAAGVVTAIALRALWDGPRLAAALLPDALTVGALLGVLSGAICGAAGYLLKLRSHWGIEWMLVGGLAGLLAAAASGPFRGRPIAGFVMLFILSGVFAEWLSALVFGPRAWRRPDAATLVGLGVTAGALIAIYWALISLILSSVD